MERRTHQDYSIGIASAPGLLHFVGKILYLDSNLSQNRCLKDILDGKLGSNRTDYKQLKHTHEGVLF